MGNETGLWPRLKALLGIRLAPADASITDRNAAKTGVALILSGLGGIALVFGYSQSRTWSVGITAVIVAAAALGVGFLFGFLFGIPRSRRGAAAETPRSSATTSTPSSEAAASAVSDVSGPGGQIATAAASDTPGGRLTVNANLEEISDWLTKIIVGIGLKELNNIPHNLDRIARYVAAGLVPTPDSPPPVTFALAIIVYFSVLGFLSGYLLTRLFLAGAFSAADETLLLLRKKDAEVKREKERVNQVIEGADQSARTKEAALAALVQQPATVDQRQGSPSDQLAMLEARYKSIRETQSPGEERTRQMTAVVREVGSLAPQLRDFDIAAALRSSQREVRLAAYALIYAEPQPDYLEPLVDSLVTYTAETRTAFDNRPFGEYWGIQALDKVLAVSKLPIKKDVAKKLASWASRLQQGTDRWFEMVKISRRYGIPVEF